MSDLWTEVKQLDELYRFEGQMLAECPYLGTLGFLGVYAIPTNSDGENAGKMVYLSDAAVDQLDVQMHDAGKSFSEVVR